MLNTTICSPHRLFDQDTDAQLHFAGEKCLVYTICIVYYLSLCIRKQIVCAQLNLPHMVVHNRLHSIYSRLIPAAH